MQAISPHHPITPKKRIFIAILQPSSFIFNFPVIKPVSLPQPKSIVIPPSYWFSPAAQTYSISYPLTSGYVLLMLLHSIYSGCFLPLALRHTPGGWDQPLLNLTILNFNPSNDLLGREICKFTSNTWWLTSRKSKRHLPALIFPSHSSIFFLI